MKQIFYARFFSVCVTRIITYFYLLWFAFSINDEYKGTKGGNVDTPIDNTPNNTFTACKLSWNCFVYIFYHHTVSDEVRSVHDALVWWCRTQDLPVLMLLGTGYRNRVKNVKSNIIHALLAFIGLKIFCLCHRNFSFTLQMSLILTLCRPKKQRERNLLIPS